MPSWNRAALALIALFGPLPAQSPAAFTESPSSRRIEWQRSLADAQALAKATGRPLLLALNMDGESASDRIWHENWRDPRFVELTRRAICLGASVFRHNATDHDADGRRIECPRFCGLTCGEHIALEPELFANWFPDGERVAPRHALIRPDGSVAFDLSLCFDLQDVDRALAAATEGIEPWQPATAIDWVTLAGRRDAAGRDEFERRLLRIDDERDRRQALAAIAQHGDAGSLEALTLLLANVPELPLASLLDTAKQLGIEAAFRARCWQHAQRLGPIPGTLTPPPFVAAVRPPAFDGEELRHRMWRCALVAIGDAEVESLRTPPRPLDDVTTTEIPPAVSMRFETLAAPVAIADLLALGERLCAGRSRLPAPGLPKRALAGADELHRRLADLDAQLAQRRDDPELLAELGIHSLDLGRVQLDAGGQANTQFLFDDADRYLRRASEQRPERYDWWLERARTAFYFNRFDQQVEFGKRALSLCGFDWPVANERREALALDLRAIEAVNWIADGEARLFANETFADPIAAIGRMRSIVLGLGLAAMSPYGDENDLIGFASFVESIGLMREELAILVHGQRRLPVAPAIRRTVYAALWAAGRPELAPALADAAGGATPSADALWWSGHARLLLAEDLRRRERTTAAVHTYDEAHACFAAAGTANPAYAESVQQHRTIAWLGAAMAQTQGPRADRTAAATTWAQSLAHGGDPRQLRDGLGYDALDLIDKLVEWRLGGPFGDERPSPRDLLALLPTGHAHEAFWAAAISDSALREALRADGRNPERREGDTVDASGKPIRALMGLPTELGDTFLAQAIEAGARAANSAGASAESHDEIRTVHAQALVIFAERELLRDRTAGVAVALGTAATALGLEVAPSPEADAATLRALAASLRERLGPARPRQRDGR
jgi:hypothetical protein